MSQDFWDNLVAGHTASTFPSSFDYHLNGNPSEERFTSVRNLTESGRRAGSLKLPVPSGTMVIFAGDLGSMLSMSDPPGRGMPGEVVSVKSAGNDITSHEGMVFVKWADGKFRQVHADYLRLAKIPEAKTAVNVRQYPKNPAIDSQEYPEKKGLEGPFRFRDGRTLYYDPKVGEYYDSKTDMYVEAPKTASQDFKADLDDACWEGYEAYGMKEKDGKKVPNCIPVSKKKATRIRVSSLGDLTQFLKTADGKLVHKSTKDLWSFKKDADGGILIERMFDGEGKPLKG